MLIDQDEESKITKEPLKYQVLLVKMKVKQMIVRQNKRSQQKKNSLTNTRNQNETIEPIVLEPQAKKSKVQRIQKNRKAFQDAKKKGWKTESKLHTRYSKLSKAAEGKAKEFIEQEALETLETEEDCYYKCEFCSIVTRRHRMIHCSHCKKWYHATCFPMAFECSLEQVFILC